MPGSAVAEGKASLKPTVQEICHHLSLNTSCGRINFERNLGNKIIESHAHGTNASTGSNASTGLHCTIRELSDFTPLKLAPNTDNSLYPSHLISVNDYIHLIKNSGNKEREASPPYLKEKSQNHDEQNIHV